MAELVEQDDVGALAIGTAADQNDVARPAAMRAKSDPHRVDAGDSSPMKVREEPVTPCTIEMLPASRLDDCARNSVGRRSLISRSFTKRSRLSTLP